MMRPSPRAAFSALSASIAKMNTGIDRTLFFLRPRAGTIIASETIDNLDTNHPRRRIPMHLFSTVTTSAVGAI